MVVPVAGVGPIDLQQAQGPQGRWSSREPGRRGESGAGDTPVEKLSDADTDRFDGLDDVQKPAFDSERRGRARGAYASAGPGEGEPVQGAGADGVVVLLSTTSEVAASTW
jgi:hypothetical protein